MNFDQFFHQEHDRLVRFCWLLTLNRDAAADVAQEAMARAWKAWPDLSQPGNNPAGWLRTVATNLARSRWRQATRALDFTRRQRIEPGPIAVSDPAVVDALRSLSPRQREVVVLRYWADLKLADCAEAMGLSEGSAKRHLTRAHANLQELLDPSNLQELTL